MGDRDGETGGNGALSGSGKGGGRNGVTSVGHDNVTSRLAEDASALYARNLLNFITPLVGEKGKPLNIDRDDEIIKGALVTIGGKVVHPDLTGKGKGKGK